MRFQNQARDASGAAETGVIMSMTSADPVSQGYVGNARESEDVRISPLGLIGSLRIPKNAYALVVFAHGSGSSRLSPRNVAVAHALNDRGIATLLFDLLTPAEEVDRANVFNIPLLAGRLVDAVRWLDGDASAQSCRWGCSAPARERRPRWSRRRSFLAVSAQWSRGAGAPTSPVVRSTKCTRQPF